MGKAVFLGVVALIFVIICCVEVEGKRNYYYGKASGSAHHIKEELSRQMPPQIKMDSEEFMEVLFSRKSPFSRWVNFESKITEDDIREFKARRVDAPLTPVIIVPSLIGSVLMATLKDFQSWYFFCPKTVSDPFYLWMDDSNTFLFYITCWFEHMTLQFNSSSNTTFNASGVYVNTVDYGGVLGVSYLDSKQKAGVWNDTIAILQALGYEVGKNLRAAPFDWRRGPVEYMQYDFPRLKNLVEETYYANGNQSIAFVSLSMGSPYFLSFLNNAVTQEWKDQFVHSFTSWDGAFGGSVESILGTVDANFLANYINPWTAPFGIPFRNMLNSFSSFLWMYPIKDYLGTDIATVTTGTYGTFTTDNWPELLAAAGFSNASLALSWMAENNLTSFQAPGVKTYCVFGYGVKTAQSITYPTDFNSPSNVTYGDGDMTVLLDGLDICSKFKSQQKQPMISQGIKGMVHGSSVHNKDVIAAFVRSLFSSSEKTHNFSKGRSL